MVMKLTVVRGHKGKITTRNQSGIVSDDRADLLVAEYATGPSKARRELARQWGDLVARGVTMTILSEEFGVSISTISRALSHTDVWCDVAKQGGRIAVLNHRKGRRRRTKR